MTMNRLISILLAALVSGGCLNSATVLKVKPDGSGTIEQTLLMNMAAMKGMLGGLDPQGMKQSGPFNEAELKRSAERMGKGVRFVSSTPMKSGGFEGAKAIFAFDDITQVQVDQDPNLSGGSGGAGQTTPAKKSPVTFKLDRAGGSSKLTVTFDEKTTAPASTPTPDASAKMDPAMFQMVKTMFQGFKVAIDLEVEGKIVKTNADYVNGSRITLLEIDMGALLEDEAKLKSLQSVIKPGASIADVKPLLKDFKGVKINHSVVTIEYR